MCPAIFWLTIHLLRKNIISMLVVLLDAVVVAYIDNIRIEYFRIRKDVMHALFSLLQKESRSSHEIVTYNYGITDTSYKMFSYQRWMILVAMESQNEGSIWNLTYATLAFGVWKHNLWHKKLILKKSQLNLN